MRKLIVINNHRKLADTGAKMQSSIEINIPNPIKCRASYRPANIAAHIVTTT